MTLEFLLLCWFSDLRAKALHLNPQSGKATKSEYQSHNWPCCVGQEINQNDVFMQMILFVLLSAAATEAVADRVIIMMVGQKKYLLLEG